ncbi:MAG TPA: DUF4133 domain-containing protein [Anseongella sp.]
MTMRKYPVYKGLQRPLIYRGFKGKFIFYGLGSLVLGIVAGGLLGSLTNMYLGGVLMISCISGGLLLTANLQKRGLHSKTRHAGVFIHPVKLRLPDAKKENGF